MLARLPSSLNHNVHEHEHDTDTDVNVNINMNMDQVTRDRPEADCRPVSSPVGAARYLTTH